MPGEEAGSKYKKREGYDDERLILGGGGRIEEGKEIYRKMVESGGAGGLDINFVTIATVPRCGGVTIRGWNTTTSKLGHTSCTGGQLHTHTRKTIPY